MTALTTPVPYSDGTPARRIIPGAREPRVDLRTPPLGLGASIALPSGNLLDPATTADRCREGGGAPDQRRKPGEGSGWERFMSLDFGR